MNIVYIYTALLSFALVFTHVNAASNETIGKSEKNLPTLNEQAITRFFDDQNKDRGLFRKFQDNRHMSPRVKMRLVELAEEEARLENDMRLEEEKRAKIYRQHLASRVQSSIMRDFLTSRY